MQDIKLIAEELNQRADNHPIGQLQGIREKIKSLKRLPSRKIFTHQTIHESDRDEERSYAFHHGGRTELQFNIGIENTYEGGQLRHGVAFSFQPSQSLPDINVLVPKAKRFSEYLQMYPEQFADMRMWHYRNGKRSGDYAAGAILPELVMPNVFVFFGKRQLLAGMDYEAILADFDRLLPLYEYVESGHEGSSDQAFGGFSFQPRTTVRAHIANGTLAERQLNITLRHNMMQEILCQKLIAEYGVDNVGMEHASIRGTKIDIVLRTGTEQYTYFEIKTASTPRGCIREALGQILEYSYWPKAKEAKNLVICGESELDSDGAVYLGILQSRFKLPIRYEQIKLTSDVG